MLKLLNIIAFILTMISMSAFASEPQDLTKINSNPVESKLISVKCLSCHSRQRIDTVRIQNKDAEVIIKKMEGRGVTMSDNERKSIKHFLSSPYKSDHQSK